MRFDSDEKDVIKDDIRYVFGVLVFARISEFYFLRHHNMLVSTHLNNIYFLDSGVSEPKIAF